MKAMVLEGAGLPLQLRDLEVSRPGPGQVLIQGAAVLVPEGSG